MGERLKKYLRLNLLLFAPTVLVTFYLYLFEFPKNFCIISGYCPQGFWEKLVYYSPEGFIIGLVVLPYVSALFHIALRFLPWEIDSFVKRADWQLGALALIVFILMVPVSFTLTEYLEQKSNEESCKDYLDGIPVNETFRFGVHIQNNCFRDGAPLVDELEGIDPHDTVKKTHSGYKAVSDD